MNLAKSSAWAIAAVLLAAAASPQAEEIYKSVAKDGSVTYSSTPIEGATNTPFDVDKLSPEQRRAALRLRDEMQRANQALDDAHAKRAEAWRLADVEVRDATEKLLLEEAKLRAEREPRSNEWIANAGGGTRLTQGYFDRLKELEALVSGARERLDRAYEARAALK